ncbi:FAD-dependent oxidoreductase [Dehalogenimonas sp. THU2]|uniref:FAD-dependent oxidoreductase n=1 Tax=Dehalogenimonas sp. THU2 TaxID=3151121 RepID=UPI0032187284
MAKIDTKTAAVIVPEARVGRRTHSFGRHEEFNWSEAKCTACGRCSRICPVDAITLDRTMELTKRMRAAPCSQACPAGLDASRYVRFIAEGKFAEAAAVMRERVPFPLVLGHVCRRPCESECQRGKYEGSLLLRALKRFAAANDSGLWRQQLQIAPPTGKRAAVIGSGPAGLSIAYYLTLLGHQVTVFEALPDKGGKMLSSIPYYQLPKDVVTAEINIIESLGVEIRTNSTVESVAALLGEGFDGIALAIGVKGWGKSLKLPIPGARSEGVIDGESFIKNIETGWKIETGKRVAVLGGGSVAFKAALAAVHSGAGEVHIFGQEHTGGAEADPWEIDEALAEGVITHSSSLFYRVIAGEGRVLGVGARKIRALGYDAEGELDYDPLPAAEEVFTADYVVSALGADGAPVGPMEVGPSVFAAGDAVNEQRSVVESIAAARWVAAAMDRYFGGSGDLDQRLAPPESARALTPIREFRSKFPPAVPVKQIRADDGSLAASEQTLPATAAVADAGRCLKCDLTYELKDYRLDTGVCVFCGRCIETCYWNAITPGAGYETAKKAAEIKDAGGKRYATVLTALVAVGVVLIAAVLLSKLGEL